MEWFPVGLVIEVGVCFCAVFVVFVFALGVPCLVQGAQGVDQFLPPVEAEVFLADGQGVVHRLVQPQAEDEDEVFDVLVDVGQVFGDVAGDGLVAVLHVFDEYVQVVVAFGQDGGQCQAQDLVGFFRHVVFGFLVSHRFARGQQRGLQIQQGQYLQHRVDKSGASRAFGLFHVFAEFGGHGDELYDVAVEYRLAFFFHFLFYCLAKVM